jgi:hypothetical protein
MFKMFVGNKGMAELAKTSAYPIGLWSQYLRKKGFEYHGEYSN